MLGVKHIGKDSSNGNVLTKNWSCVASDASGTNLAACVYSEYIYISKDFGKTWTQTTAPNKRWTSITMDPTGQYLTAFGEGNDGFYSNSNYGQGEWTKQKYDNNDIRNLYGNCTRISNDGKQVLTLLNTTNIVVNDNYGTTSFNYKWANTISGLDYISSFAEDAEGNLLIGYNSGSNMVLYIEKDDTSINSFDYSGGFTTDGEWTSIIFGNDAKKPKLFYASNVDTTSEKFPGIYNIEIVKEPTTTTKAQLRVTKLKDITSVSSLIISNDGTKLAACSGTYYYRSYTTAKDYDGYIYTSTDSGVIWTKQDKLSSEGTNLSKQQWSSIASNSSDSSQFVACAYGGNIYTLAYNVTNVTFESGSEIFNFISDDTIVGTFTAIQGQLNTKLLEDGDYSDPSIRNIFERLKFFVFSDSTIDITKYNLAAFLSAEAYAQAYTEIVYALTDKYNNGEITIEEYDKLLEISAEQLAENYPTWYFNNLIKIEAAIIKYRYILLE
jgi:hypothetical protein